MKRARAWKLASQFAAYARNVCPYDTGNMHNTIRVEAVSPTEVRVIIGGDLAPYAPYTNEPWISERWRGKKNPNEGWIDNAVETFVQKTAKQLRGNIERG